MKLGLFIFFTIACLVLANAAQKNPLSKTKKLSLVENYLDSSGMEKNFSVPNLILQKHLTSPVLSAKFTSPELEKLLIFFQNRLNAERIEEYVKVELLNSFTIGELIELNELYENDLMKKVASIEEYNSSDEALEKANLFFKDKENLNHSTIRNRLLTQLIEVQGADTQAQELTLESIRGLHRGLKKILPKEKRVSDEKANLAIGLISRTPPSNFRNTLLLRYQYSYRDLSDLELKNLIELSNNKLIRKARKASMSGIKKAFLTI